MSLRASLIMPTRNRADILRLALPRMLDQTLPATEYEIIVVDDASDDDTGAAIAESAAPNLRHARNDHRMAAGMTRNRAVGMAQGRYLIFVDDDALVRPDYVEQHLATHEGGVDTLVAGPIIDVNEPPADRSPAVGRWLGRHTNPFPTGNASVARETFLRAGGFDEDFTAYGWEDTEMYRRLRMLKLGRRYNWRAPIFHYKPAAVTRDFFARLDLEQSRGAMGALYYAKHPHFSVGMETKLLGFFRGLDRLVDRALDLDGRIAAARAIGVEPRSAFMRLLMINHTEITAGLRKWDELGGERRRDLAMRARAKVA